MAETGAPPRAADAKVQSSKVLASKVLAEAGRRRAFATWGTALYWWAAMLYLVQVRSLVSQTASSLGTKARP